MTTGLKPAVPRDDRAKIYFEAVCGDLLPESTAAFRVEAIAPRTRVVMSASEILHPDEFLPGASPSPRDTGTLDFCVVI